MKKEKGKALALAMAAAVTAGLLSGCGSGSSSAERTSAESETASGTAVSSAGSASESGSTAAAGTKTITDAQGNPAEVPDPLDHVAFVDWPAGEAITILLERQDALSLISSNNAENAMINEFYPELSSLPVTPDAASGSIEEYMKNGVQLVYCIDDYSSMFENAGIPTLAPDYYTAEGIQNTVLMMGEAFGGDAYTKAQEYVKYYTGNLEKLTEVSNDLSDEEKVRVYFATNTGLRTEGGASISNSWMEAGGGINVATENGIADMVVQITVEEIMTWDPDIIIAGSTAAYEELLDQPALAGLDAFQNGQVYVAPKGIYTWAHRSSEAAIMPLWAATIINPDLYADIDMAEETRNFYSEFYGMDLTDEQIQSILDPAGINYD